MRRALNCRHTKTKGVVSPFGSRHLGLLSVIASVLGSVLAAVVFAGLHIGPGIGGATRACYELDAMATACFIIRQAKATT